MELLEGDGEENLGDLGQEYGLAQHPPTIRSGNHAPWFPPKGVERGRPPKTCTQVLTAALFLMAKLEATEGFFRT